MLLALEKEKKLRTFNVFLKNVSYMGVRLYDIEETDTAFVNYCSTFKRTFDSVELKIASNTESASFDCSINNSNIEKDDESVQDADLDNTNNVKNYSYLI